MTRVLVDYTRFHNSVKCVSATIDGGILISVRKISIGPLYLPDINLQGVGKYSLTQWEATETTFVCTSGAFACEGMAEY